MVDVDENIDWQDEARVRNAWNLVNKVSWIEGASSECCLPSVRILEESVAYQHNHL